MKRFFLFLTVGLTVLTMLSLQVSPIFASDEDSETLSGTEKLKAVIKTAEERSAERSNKGNDAKTKLEQRIANKEDAVKNRCLKTNTNIEKIIENYDNNVSSNINTYTTLKNNIEKVVTLLENKGADVTNLKSELKILDGKIQQLAIDRDGYINELRNSQSLICNNSDGEFKNKVENARKELPRLRSDINDIKDYIKNTIRPELLIVRQSLNTNNSK